MHPGLHYLFSLATDSYERVLGIVAQFLGAVSENEIILSIMENHANIVPWHFLRELQGGMIQWINVDSTGTLDPEKVLAVITPQTKLIAVTPC
jgi:cysteine desulfurase/selenocysteine lyase